MSDYCYSMTAPTDWEKRCDNAGALFGSLTWQELLENSFGCQTIYASGDGVGAAISAFTAGPFRVGYLGFPVGGALGNAQEIPKLLVGLRKAQLPRLPVCIRIPSSAFVSPLSLDLPAVTNPETAIIDLQEWDLASVSKNLRRDIRKAERTSLVIDECADRAAGAEIYDMYSATVQRHSGNLRYTEDYFLGLTNLARYEPRLRIFLARSGDDVAGFAVTARHGSTTNYLHGGSRLEFRQQSPSDLLLNTAIEVAKQDGSRCFNLMASPTDQPSLVRYKEKWGSETRELSTYTLPLRRSYKLFWLAEHLYRYLR